ncbi:MAG: ParB N-terminal domain-containing protein [Clostridia bacterium]
MALKNKPLIELEDFNDMLNFDVSVQAVTQLNLSDMKAFPNHKFKLYEGQQLGDMVQSIADLGILMPIILWHKDDEYIILSGHNRVNAAKIAGLTKAPVIIKSNLSYEEAVLIVTETNLRQRSFSDLSHSERAYCLAEHYQAMKSQGKRNDLLNEIEQLLNADEIKENLTSSQVENKLKTLHTVGKEYNLSKDKVARYIRIASLEKTLMDMLDDGEIAFLTAYTLSFISNEEFQLYIAEFSTNENYKIDMKKAEMLREYFEKSKLSIALIEEILSGEKTRKPKGSKPKYVKVKDAVIKKYFINGESTKEIEETIVQALEAFFEN